MITLIYDRIENGWHGLKDNGEQIRLGRFSFIRKVDLLKTIKRRYPDSEIFDSTA